MNVRSFACVGGVALVGLVVACSGAAPDTVGSGSGSIDGKGGSSGTAPTASATGSGALPTTPAPASGDGGASGSGGKGSSSGDDPPVKPADPTCLAQCAASLAPKCQGDATFCDDVCGVESTAVVACLIAAPTCDKPEWTRCEGLSAGDGGK